MSDELFSVREATIEDAELIAQFNFDMALETFFFFVLYSLVSFITRVCVFFLVERDVN